MSKLSRRAFFSAAPALPLMAAGTVGAVAEVPMVALPMVRSRERLAMEVGMDRAYWTMFCMQVAHGEAPNASGYVHHESLPFIRKIAANYDVDIVVGDGKSESKRQRLKELRGYDPFPADQFTAISIHPKARV